MYILFTLTFLVSVLCLIFFVIKGKHRTKKKIVGSFLAILVSMFLIGLTAPEDSGSETKELTTQSTKKEQGSEEKAAAEVKKRENIEQAEAEKKALEEQQAKEQEAAQKALAEQQATEQAESQKRALEEQQAKEQAAAEKALAEQQAKEQAEIQQQQALEAENAQRQAAASNQYVDENGNGTIKGSSSGIYHVPGSTYYDRTTNPVAFFKSVEEAESAGYRAPKR